MRCSISSKWNTGHQYPSALPETYALFGRQIHLATRPDIKCLTRLTYSDDIFNISLNWQHIGKVTETLGGSATEPDLPNIKSQNYFDLNDRFIVAKSFEFFGGVQNRLDKQPPLVNSGFTLTNTDETLYDPLGRRFFVGAKVNF